MSDTNTPSENRHVADIVFVGHVSRDLQSDDVSGPYRIGGTVSYGAVVAAHLGRHPGIITSTAADTDLSELPSDTLLHNKQSDVSTTFANIYTPDGRIQYSYSQALPISADDIPPEFQSPSAALLGPLVGEVEPAVANAFAADTLVVVIPQGWMRQIDETGHVHIKEWDNYAEILPHIDVLVLSLEDIDYDLTRLDPMFEHIPLVILTEYHDGSTVHRKRSNGDIEIVKIPPRPANELDPTGAGDVFTTAFMIRYQETNDPIESARFANITASYSVEHPGVSGIPTRDQVMSYMHAHPFEPVVGVKPGESDALSE